VFISGNIFFLCPAARCYIPSTTMQKTPAPRRKLTILSLAAATYFMVSGGPYGME